MTMVLVYKLVGFDRKTEALAIDYVIPAEKIQQAKTVAGTADNPAIIADWPLSRDQASAIAALVEADVDPGKYDWALEPYEAP
jgi:hypothetical protein